MHCKRRVQIQDLQDVFTACARCAHNAPTALKKTSQRCHSVPTARCLTRLTSKRQAAAFVLSMFKINVLDDCAASSQRFQSVSTALLANAQRAPRRSATFLTLRKRCDDAALV